MITGGDMKYDTDVTGNALFSFDAVNAMLDGNMVDVDGAQ